MASTPPPLESILNYFKLDSTSTEEEIDTQKSKPVDNFRNIRKELGS